MAPALCGSIVQSRRGLLAVGWSLVTILSVISFVTALIFATMATNEDDYDEGNDNDGEAKISVTSRAMAFAALWTALLSLGMSVFGTIILGWQSPTGIYYVCFPGKVHRTTSLSLGTFIGALLMYSNLTLVCSIIFGEFQIRDYQKDGEAKENNQDGTIDRSSLAFSIMCLFLTVLYAGFAAIVYFYHESIIEETLADAREEALQPSPDLGVNLHPGGGYVGGKLNFSNPPSSKPGTLT